MSTLAADRIRRIAPLLLAGLAALLAVLAARPFSRPIMGDSGYLLYMGQTVARGQPLYSTTTFGYPPLAPLLMAGVIEVGGWAGMASYLAVRAIGAAVAVATAALVASVALRATRSSCAALIAGLAMAGFGLFTSLSASGLEPRPLICLFGVGGVWFVQRRMWLAAGASAAAAASCWQPAVVWVAALLTVAAVHDRNRPRAARYVAGVLLGALPGLLYLTLSGAWADFLLQGVENKYLNAAGSVGARGLVTDRLLPVLSWFGWRDLPLLVGGLAGFLVFTVRSALRGSLLRRYVDPRWGGLPVALIGWLAFSSIDLAVPTDLVPFFPIAAVWIGYLLERTLRWTGTSRPAGRGIATAAVVAMAVLAVGDDVVVGLTRTVDHDLADQLRTVRRLQTLAGDDPMVAVAAPEIYVLADQPAPFRFLYVSDYFLPLLERELGPDPCPAVSEWLVRAPGIVVLGRPGPDTGCMAAARSRLDARFETIPMPGAGGTDGALRVFLPDGRGRDP